MLILLAEDDLKISKLLIELLRKDGYQVDHALNGKEVMLYVEGNTYDLIIMDWMMPEMDGLEAVKRLRQQGYENGILMLTAKDSLKNKVQGFEAGVDDYLVKPFAYEELKVRVIALLRRSQKGLEKDIFSVGQLRVDRTHKTASYKDKQLQLSKREFQLLLVLAENVGQIIPRDRLIDLVWGMDAEVTPNNLDAYIRLLRKKLEVEAYQPIVNVRGIGYKMEAEDV